MTWTLNDPALADLDGEEFAEIFAAEGAVSLQWERATRCTCYTADSHQPQWDCPLCDGNGVTFAETVVVEGLFRSQGRWLKFAREGEFALGDAQLTTPLWAPPGYTDRRVRDRYTTTVAVGDVAAGRTFFPATQPVPFIFANVQRAWRVQLQSLELSQELGS